MTKMLSTGARVVACLLLGALVVACMPAAEAYDVRPIADITADEPPQIVDITAETAVLMFTSSVPLNCVVVYGETTAYGSITSDQDMSGGAHTDHSPLLAGLMPDTVYHYRVQGSAADGTVYIGEDATFRTPSAPEQTEVNLASLDAGARVVAVSSNYGGGTNEEEWGGNSAIDGDPTTAWSSDGDGDAAFIEVALARPGELYAVEVWTRTMSDQTAQIYAFTLTTDGGEVLGPFTLPDSGRAHRFDVDVTASSLRLNVTDSSGGNTGLVEFAAYGTS